MGGRGLQPPPCPACPLPNAGSDLAPRGCANGWARLVLAPGNKLLRQAGPGLRPQGPLVPDTGPESWSEIILNQARPRGRGVWLTGEVSNLSPQEQVQAWAWARLDSGVASGKPLTWPVSLPRTSRADTCARACGRPSSHTLCALLWALQPTCHPACVPPVPLPGGLCGPAGC